MRLVVLQLVHSLEVGGLERVVTDLCSGSVEAGLESHLGCVSHLGPLGVEATVAGQWIGGARQSRIPIDLRALASLTLYIRRRGVKLIHSHNPSAHLYGALASVTTGVPHVHTVHGLGLPLGPSSTRRAWLRRMLTRRTACVVAVSPEVASKLIEADHLPASKIVTIMNGVDATRFSPAVSTNERSRLRAERGFGRDALVIGSVGRLAPEKNHVLLVTAFASLLRRHPMARLAIVGDGPEKPRLAAAWSTRPTAALVLAGTRQDIPEWLRCFDIHCLPSDSEGTSIALLEAMASGLPSVATDVGANRSLLAVPTCGAVVPPREQAALAAALDSLARDPARRRAMGAAGRQRVLDHFTLGRMVNEYAALYRRVTGVRPASRPQVASATRGAPPGSS